MLVCVQCRVEMYCDKNSVGADFGNGHVYASDRFKCPGCGMMLLNSNETPYFDPEYKLMDAYLAMRKNGGKEPC